MKLIVITALLLMSVERNVGSGQICNSVEIRSYKSLNLLTNCSVVEGNLILIFPDVLLEDNPDYTSEEINNRSFPLLREVTGFVLIVKIKFAKSLQKLFPNLTVIRGRHLFGNYALTIYDCEYLEDINLNNLLKISRGSVRVGGYTVRLCLPRKIDFSRILSNGRFIVEKEVSLQATNCIGAETCFHCALDGLCWNNKYCQRYDKWYKSTRGRECHELCLGPCFDDSASGCYVCEDLSEDFVCKDFCSAERLLNVDTRRCIAEEECTRLGQKIHDKQCLSDCPKNYTDEFDEQTNTTKCVPCVEKCPKYCNFSEIKTLRDLQKFGTGCTIINDNLEIKFEDDIRNINEELEMFLGDVEEIHGNLKIYRSPSIVSLTFLNNLKFVKGSNSTGIAVEIFENQNLQTLFDWRARQKKSLHVLYGSVIVHSNILLCENETYPLKDIIEPKDSKSRKYDYIFGNGNLCRNQFIKTFYEVESFDRCNIKWKDTYPTENVTSLGYIIQYVSIDDFEKKEFDENVFFSREKCSIYGWNNVLLNNKTYNTTKDSDGNVFYNYTLKNLHQYTVYVFTIQPYIFDTSDANKTISGSSKVNSFKTPMNVPSRVTRVSTLVKTANSIMLDWEVTAKEKDEIKQFIIFVYEKSFLNDELDQRNYCKNPISDDDERHNFLTNIRVDEYNLIPSDNDGNDCCEKCCNEEEKRRKLRKMENDQFRQDLVELSRTTLRENRANHRLRMKKRSGFVKEILVFNDTSVNVKSLKAFTIYSFHVYACTEDKKCSDYEIYSDRTAMDETFDRVDLRFGINQFLSDTFRVYIGEPSNVNGAIIKYLIEIRKITDNETHPALSDCITRKAHERNKFIYSASGLSEGDYLFRVTAVSLAQIKPYTDWHLFKIIRSNEYPVLIYISLGFVIALMIGAGTSYYYKHKLLNIFRRMNDTSPLINEMAPIDFLEISQNHSNDGLYSINEDDE